MGTVRALVYTTKGRRSDSLAMAVYQGLQQCGETVKLKRGTDYQGPEKADYVVWYGLAGNGMKMLTDFQACKMPFAYLDLGYFGRKRESPPLVEFHRVAVNSYQPTSYLRRNLPPTRFLQFKRPIQSWRTQGEEILVIGMSDKAAKVWGLGSGTEHAQWLVDEVRKHTDRPIAYSPKPSWKEAVPIEGTRYARGPLQDELNRAHCVVTWRSNVAIDGLLAGIPCFVLGDNPALLMSHNDLTKIEQPQYPDDRLAFCGDLAHCQFSLAEITNGYAFRQLKVQGLLP